MTNPAVNIQELDGALGVLPASEGALLAVIGASSSGPIATPATYARAIGAGSLAAAFGVGDGVEDACYHITRSGKPVVFVRATDAVDGSATAVVFTGTGTSVITVDVDPISPLGSYEVALQVIAGGTIGVTGITFKYSLDGERTWSPTTALGTANTYEIPNSGVVLAFAAGTLVAADKATTRTTGAKWDTAALQAALTALGNSSIEWEMVAISGPITASDVDTIETIFAGWRALGKFHSWFASTRIPTIGESEATYLSSLSESFAAKSTVNGAICAGAGELVSAVSGRKYLRPILALAASREAASSHEINQADVNLGALPITIKDANGNPKHHDEFVNPGLDDARFYTLRTWPGNDPAGVFVNRPRLFSPQGSDFQLVPHRRVLNLAERALLSYFIRRLNSPIYVNPLTGFILESEALEIETGALAMMRSVLLAKPKASGVQFALSRFDNLLSTKTLNGEGRVIPVGYAEFINISVGYFNPALQVLAA